MSKLIIRGIAIENATFHSQKNGGAFTLEVKYRAAWSDTVCKEMGWVNEPSGFGNGTLIKKLTGISLSIEPNAKTLKDYAIEITIGQVSSFRHIAKTTDGKVSSHEFEFVTISSGDAALAALPYVAEYVNKCGPAGDRGQCVLTYNAEAQMKIGENATAGSPEAPEAEQKARGRRKAAGE